MADGAPREVARAGAWAVVLAVAVATLVYMEALTGWAERVVGAPNTESYPFLWGFFWMAQSLIDQGRFAYETTLLNHPSGGILWLKEPIFTVILTPFFNGLGAAGAFTLTQITHCVLGTMGAAMLATTLGTGPLIAALVGLTYGFCPHMLGEAYNGNLDAMNIAWAPLWLTAMIHLIKRPSVTTGLAGALALSLLLLANQYFALATALASTPIAIAALVGRHRRGEPLLPAFVYGGAALTLGLALVLPSLWLLLESLNDPRSLSLFDEDIPLVPPYVSDAAHLWNPLKVFDNGPPPTTFQDLVYPGLGLVALACLAPVIAKGRRGWAMLCVALGALYTALSLGPILLYKGVAVAGGEIWLPWHYLIEGKPLLGSMTLPHRMAIPAGLFWTVAAALGLGAMGEYLRKSPSPLFSRLRRPFRWSLAMLIPLLLGSAALAEQLLYPPYAMPLATFSLPSIGSSYLLGKLSAPGAVLNLPPLHSENSFNAYLYHQTIHKRPIAGSLRVGEWPDLAHKVPLFGRDAAYLWDLPPVPQQRPDPDDPYGVEALRAAGFGFVLFHLGALHEPGRGHLLPTWALLLGEALGEGLLLDDGTVIYALDPDVAATLEADATDIMGPEWIVSYELDWHDRIDMVTIRSLGPLPKDLP